VRIPNISGGGQPGNELTLNKSDDTIATRLLPRGYPDLTSGPMLAISLRSPTVCLPPSLASDSAFLAALCPTFASVSAPSGAVRPAPAKTRRRVRCSGLPHPLWPRSQKALLPFFLSLQAAKTVFGPYGLENNLQRKLLVEGFTGANSWSPVEVTNRVEYTPKATGVQFRAWRRGLIGAPRARNRQIRSIEQIEHLHSELGPYTLGDGGVLHNGEVNVRKTGSKKSVSRKRAEGAWSRLSESGRVQILHIPRAVWICDDPLTRAAVWIADQIHPIPAFERAAHIQP
jgi:hypothetical protein